MTDTKPGLLLGRPRLSPRIRIRTRKYARRAGFLLALAIAFLAGAAWGLGGQQNGPRACTDPATHGRVVAGDAILNNGQEYVCTDGTLVHVDHYGNTVPADSTTPLIEYRVLPRWARFQYLHTAECGRDRAAIVAYSTVHGGDNAALICRNGKVENS